MSTQTNIDQHHRLIEMSPFQRAIAVTKAEYVRRLHATAPQDLASLSFASASAMCFQRIQGMEDFCLILMNLAEPIPVPSKMVSDINLEEPKLKS